MEQGHCVTPNEKEAQWTTVGKFLHLPQRLPFFCLGKNK
jgi:hypothetical protein